MAEFTNIAKTPEAEQIVAEREREAQAFLERPKMIIHTNQCGQRHFATTSVAENVRLYKQAFGLAESTVLVGMVYTQIVNTHAVGPGVPIEVALANEAELAAKASKPVASGDGGCTSTVKDKP
jgi:hypothetical protein